MRKSSSAHQFIAPCGLHNFRPGAELSHALLRQSSASSLHHRHLRPNSSLARAKAAQRRGGAPRQDGKPEASVSDGTDGSETVPTLSPQGLELSNEMAREKKLTAEYYEAVKSDKDVLWVPWDELKEVPDSIATKWLYKPADSYVRRCGLARCNVDPLHIAAYVSDPHVRRKLMIWRHDPRTVLTQQFKEMLMSRATIARLAGLKSYFQYQSQFKVLSQESVTRFLEDLLSQIRPYRDALIENVLEQKLRDLNYDISQQDLTNSLRHHGKSIRDFQIAHKDIQVNLGDVAYYENNRVRMKGARVNPEHENVSGYFPLDHVITRLLPIFGDLFGMDFIELFPGDQGYQKVVPWFFKAIQLRERDVSLRIFAVKDAGMIPKPLGYLVLDLFARHGKPLGPFIRPFAKFKFKHLQDDTLGIMFSASFATATSKSPTLLCHDGLVTLAHEFGHVIHTLARGHLAGVPQDFVEIPSIMLENWVHLPKVLQQISCHYTYLDPIYSAAWQARYHTKVRPPQQAPLNIFDHIKYNQHPKNSLVEFQTLLWMSVFDLEVHGSSEEDLKNMNLGIRCRQILESQTGTFNPPDGLGENNNYRHWNNLRGYETSMYTYPLAKVWCYDLFNKHFARDPFNRRKGRLYRRLILEHRDTPREPSGLDIINRFHDMMKFLYFKVFRVPQTSMDALTKFMGRKPNSKAFVKALKAPANKNQTLWRRMGIKMGIVW